MLYFPYSYWLLLLLCKPSIFHSGPSFPLLEKRWAQQRRPGNLTLPIFMPSIDSYIWVCLAFSFIPVFSGPNSSFFHFLQLPSHHADVSGSPVFFLHEYLHSFLQRGQGNNRRFLGGAEIRLRVGTTQLHCFYFHQYRAA